MGQFTPRVVSGVWVLPAPIPLYGPVDASRAPPGAPLEDLDVDVDMDLDGLASDAAYERNITPAIPLTRRRRYARFPEVPELQAGGDMDEAFASADADVVQQVSRKRSRLARAAFFVIVAAVLALLVWELAVLYASHSDAIRGLFGGLR